MDNGSAGQVGGTAGGSSSSTSRPPQHGANNAANASLTEQKNQDPALPPAHQGGGDQPRTGSKKSLHVSFAFAKVKHFNHDGDTITEEHFDIEPLPPESPSSQHVAHQQYMWDEENSEEFPAIGDAFLGKARSPVKPSKIRRDSIGNLAAFFDPLEDEDDEEEEEAQGGGQERRASGGRGGSNAGLDGIRRRSGSGAGLKREQRRISVISDDNDDVFSDQTGVNAEGGAGDAGNKDRHSDGSIFGDSVEERIPKIGEPPDQEDSFFEGLKARVGLQGQMSKNSQVNASELSSIHQATGTADFRQGSFNETFRTSVSRGEGNNSGGAASHQSGHARARADFARHHSSSNSNMNISPSPARSMEGSSKRRRPDERPSVVAGRDITGQVKSMADLIEDMDPLAQRNLSGQFDQEFESMNNARIVSRASSVLGSVARGGSGSGMRLAPGQLQENAEIRRKSVIQTPGQLQENAEIRRKSVIQTEGGDLMDDISSVGEEECDTPSFGGSPDAKRRASGRGSRAGANGAQQHAGNSTFGATRGLAGRATSGAFDPSRASSIHGNSRISQFSSSWESFSRHNSMAERDSRMMRSPRRESVYSDDMEAAGGMRGRFGMRPAAEQLSAELRAGGPGTAMSIEEDDELSKQIVIKVPAGLKDALARRPLNIIPPEERARMGLNNSNISGVLENGGGNPEQVSALEDHDRARSLSGDRLGAGRSSASFYIPEGTTASEHSPQKTPNNEQVGGSSASRGTPRFPLWAMSFEEFKQNLNLGDVLQKTTDCILKYKLPLDGDPDVDKKKRAAGLLPLYPPVSIVADLNEWQQSSASFPAVQILLGTNVTEEDKQTLRRLALSAIEQSAAEKAAEHYKGAIAPLYATEKQRVQTESTALERERETLEAKVKFLEKQRREQAAEEQKLEAERAREERRREEIRSVAAYAAQLREQIAQAEMVVDQKRAAVAHNTSVIQQNNQGQVGNGGGVDLNNSSMELEMWQRELGRVVGGANISSQQNTTAAPQVTDEDIELALKSVAELRTEVDALKIENEKKRLAQRLSLWRSREGKPDRLYLHPVGHELRFTANNSVVDQSHSSAPRWTFTPHAGPEVPLRIAQKLAPEMYQAVWTQARGAPNANSASWQMLLGYKLRQVDRFLHALNGIPRCSLEDTPHFLIFHVMVCPSIDVTSTGFSENYTIPPGTKRSFWIFDLLLSRSELLKYAGHLHDIDWIAKLMVRCRQPHIKSLLEGAIKDVVADESAFARRMAPGALRMFIRDLTKEIHKKILSDLEIANSPEWHAAAASLMTGPHQAIAAASSAQQQQQQGQGFGHGSSSASASDGNFMQLTNFPGQGGQQLASSSHSQQQQYGAAGSAAGAGGNMTRGHPYGRMGGNIMPSPERSVLESVLPTFVK